MVVDYAREALSIERLVIITDTDNVPSRGVAEAAGFRLEGPADPAEHVEIGEMLRYANSSRSPARDLARRRVSGRAASACTHLRDFSTKRKRG